MHRDWAVDKYECGIGVKAVLRLPGKLGLIPGGLSANSVSLDFKGDLSERCMKDLRPKNSFRTLSALHPSFRSLNLLAFGLSI